VTWFAFYDTSAVNANALSLALLRAFCFNTTMHTKIKIGISACLLGKNVRYDGGNRLEQGLLDALGPLVEWVPLCPEVAVGMSVPREPMQLVELGGRTRLITIGKKIDQTDAFLSRAAVLLMQLEQEGVRGFVFKARSPSCGIRDVPLFSEAGEVLGKRSGLFTEAVRCRFPSVLLEDEEQMRDSGIRAAFLEKLGA